jgi:lysylphosphatidylglycerol synthetase-like protein (DUF2156 family)
MADRLLTAPGGTPRAFAVRLAVATASSVLAALMLVSLVVVARGRRDDPTVAFGWFYQAMLLGVAVVSMPGLWRWALAARPRERVPVLPIDEEPGPRPHDGLAGNVAPPTRW